MIDLGVTDVYHNSPLRVGARNNSSGSHLRIGVQHFSYHSISLSGSVIVLTLYNSIIDSHLDIEVHFYADDTQLFVHLSHKNALSELVKVIACHQDAKMDVWIGTKQNSLFSFKDSTSKTIILLPCQSPCLNLPVSKCLPPEITCHNITKKVVGVT